MSLSVNAKPLGIEDFPLYCLFQAIMEIEICAGGLRGASERRAPVEE
jgi:hypothetical protein